MKYLTSAAIVGLFPGLLSAQSLTPVANTAASTTSVPATTTTSAYFYTQPGIAEDCDKYYEVQAGDHCAVIEADNNITHEQFIEWNPAVGDDCSALWEYYSVCVHVPGAPLTTPTPGNPQPQMPGITEDCTKFHRVKAGDICYDINQTYGITLAQFREWNSEVDAACSNLWNGYYVCVGV
ncbi:hypothetical protein BDV19DRAFT_7138 [Aspergillus venezuelensis]